MKGEGNKRLIDTNWGDENACELKNGGVKIEVKLKIEWFIIKWLIQSRFYLIKTDIMKTEPCFIILIHHSQP